MNAYKTTGLTILFAILTLLSVIVYT